MFLSLLQQRRSIRRFEDRGIEPEKLDLLIEAMLRSPSSRGLNPWEFVVVTEKKTLGELSVAKAHGAEFLAEAAAAVVICADPQCCDVWIEDCAIAAITLQYQAQDLGLGSCWAQLRLRQRTDGQAAEDYIRPLIGVPENYRIPIIVGLGYPAKSKNGHPRNRLPWRKVHSGRFERK